MPVNLLVFVTALGSVIHTAAPALPPAPERTYDQQELLPLAMLGNDEWTWLYHDHLNPRACVDEMGPVCAPIDFRPLARTSQSPVLAASSLEVNSCAAGVCVEQAGPACGPTDWIGPLPDPDVMLASAEPDVHRSKPSTSGRRQQASASPPTQGSSEEYLRMVSDRYDDFLVNFRLMLLGKRSFGLPFEQALKNLEKTRPEEVSMMPFETRRQPDELELEPYRPAGGPLPVDVAEPPAVALAPRKAEYEIATASQSQSAGSDATILASSETADQASSS